jgi:Lipase (class 3)
MDYDAQRSSLYQPFWAPTVFESAVPHMHDWVCAELSRLAYTPFQHDLKQHARLLSELKIGGFEWMDDFHAPGAQAIALRLKTVDKLVLVFSTLEPNLIDFATDKHAVTTPWFVGGHAHQGCVRILGSMWDRLTHSIGKQLDSCVFTGHGMGAALATLAASRVQSPMARVVTMGSPAVGDADFVQTLEGVQIDRYVNCCDVMCTLPPLRLDYVHAGALLYIDSEGELHRTSPAPEAIDLDRTAAHLAYPQDTKWVKDAAESRELADHAPINYVRAMMPHVRESAFQSL